MIDKELELFAQQNGLSIGDPVDDKVLLAIALEKAIATYNFASMTSYERDACRDDMRLCQKVMDQYESIVPEKV